MSAEKRIINKLREDFRALNAESYHILDSVEGPINLSLVFDTEFGESLSFNSQDLYIELNIFNTTSPANTFNLIDKINKHFKNRILTAENEFIVKFPQERPINNSRTLETDDQGITHVVCNMQARVTYNAIDRPEFQISNI